MLAIFNMLPAFPMDGGRVLRAALALRMDRVRATQLAARVGQVLALGLGLLGLIGNPFLILIALFVWIGAGSEAGAVAADASLGNQAAGRAMITEFHALAPTDPLARAIDLTLSSTQKDFPVLDGTRIVGVLTQPAILRALRDLGPEGRVEAAWRRRRPRRSALRSRRSWSGCVPLRPASSASPARGRLAGLVDLDNISEYLRIQQALAGH